MELVEPINIEDLLSKSIFFKIDQEQAIERNDEELLDEKVENDEVIERKRTQSPWLQSFDELRKTMECVGNKDDLYKKIIETGNGDTLGNLCTMNCRVHWSYSMFMQGEEYSFDSSHFGATTVRKTECDELLSGIWLALRTMCKGEEAQFVISYRLMYGELGTICGAYRIKPKADILMVAKLLDFEEIGSENACQQLTPEQLKDYPTLKQQLVEMQTKMADLYGKRAYGNAIKIGLDIIETATFCEVSTNTDESHDRNEFLIGIFVTLIDCYVHVEKYEKALIMVEKLRRLTNVERFVGVMVNQAIALGKTGDNYKEPIAIMSKAQRLYPNNELVNKTMNGLQEEHRKYTTATKSFMMKAFQVKTPAAAPAAPTAAKQNDTEAIDAGQGDPKVTEVFKLFDEIDIGNGLPLIGYTAEDLSIFKEAIKQSPNYRLKMTKTHDGQTNYTIVKTE